MSLLFLVIEPVLDYGVPILLSSWFKKIIFVLIFSLASLQVVAVELPKVDKNLSKIKKEYWKNIDQMQKQTCKPGVMKEFNNKLKDYRGSGFYLPIINNRIYSDVFPEMISELKEKISWLEKTIKRLKALKR